MEPGYELIEKESVTDLNFPQAPVLKREEDIKLLKRQLERANALGNLEHHKVKIYFEDDTSKKVLNTTIWGITDNSILLKKNMILPIRRIIKLEI
jgi:hypothetical protein